MLFSQVTAALGGRRTDSTFDVCRSMPRLSKIIVAKRVDKNGGKKTKRDGRNNESWDIMSNCYAIYKSNRDPKIGIKLLDRNNVP